MLNFLNKQNFNEKEIIFNVIYTPGTVKYLRLFALSLLKWSNCFFRLISNGCGSVEESMLKRFCSIDQRLIFFSLPFQEKLSHGKVLSYLQKMEKTPYFCFMDSDILATGPFVEDLMREMSSKTAIFSGLPVWQNNQCSIFPYKTDRMKGQFNRTKDNFVLGGTYLSVYDNNILNTLIPSLEIDFRRYYWREIPEQFRLILSGRRLKANRYDTGKILNILINDKVNGMNNIDLKNISHIGGISYIMDETFSKKFKQGLFRRLKIFIINNYTQTDQTKKKVLINRYVIQLLHSLFEDKKIPKPPIFISDELNKKIHLVTEVIFDSFEVYKSVLNDCK